MSVTVFIPYGIHFDSNANMNFVYVACFHIILAAFPGCDL